MKARWSSILLIAVSFVVSLHAQSNQITGIAHIAYRATDLDKEVAFFQKLGYEQAFANTSPDGKVTQSFIKVNDHQFIELYPRASDSQPLGMMHICFETSDVEALRQEYIKRGLEPSEARKGRAGNVVFSLIFPVRKPLPRGL